MDGRSILDKLIKVDLRADLTHRKVVG